MVSERLRAGMRAAVLGVASAGAAFAWTQGFYATATLGLLAAIWAAALSAIAATPPPPAPAAPTPPAGDDAKERRRLTAYLDLSPAPLVAREGDGVRAVNRAARRLLGADDRMLDPPPALIAALAETAPGRTTTIALHDRGAPRSFALTTGDLVLGGQVTRIGALIDIHAELQAAEAATLRDLVQVLSHEIVNALTPIASLAQTASDMLGDPDPALGDIRGAIETVARRAGGLQRFGETYRALARLPAPVLQRVSVETFARDVQRLFETRWPGIALAVDTARAPGHVQADPDQLNAAIWALLQNAAEALVEHAAPQVGLTIAATAAGVRVDVSDNGGGIAADQVEAIFRPFYTTKPEGSGVGLPLARQILRGHGGDLVVSAQRPATFHGSLANG